MSEGGNQELAGRMQDETLSQPLPLPRPRRSLGTTLLIAAVAFALGGGAVGWLIQSERLPFALPGDRENSIPSAPAAPATGAPSADLASPEQATALGTVETRLALIEDRLARINGEATAAAGNAARSEALLVAYAARRRIDQGEPLGFIADQLKLRFGSAQPEAVQTIIAASNAPVTLDELSGQLEAAAPALAGTVTEESTWSRMRRELASLFVIRRAPVPTASPAARVTRARIMLARGQIDEAIMEVERLPGASAAHGWIDAARRYEATQRALDVIETAAMLEPRALRDAAGRPIEQTSPLAAPAQAAAENGVGMPPPTAAGTAAP